MLLGLLFLFCGKSVNKLIFSISTLLSTFSLAFTISALVKNSNLFPNIQYIWTWVGAGIVSLILGVLAWAYWEVGLLGFGFFIGWNLGQWLNRINFTQDFLQSFLIVLIPSLICSLLAYIFTKVFIPLGSAFIGANLFITGLDLITNIEFFIVPDDVLHRGGFDAPSVPIWVMMASVPLLTLIGAIYQFKIS
ncbi:hypothetical protein CONCODRAFT_4234 [Conidiobolus coronatus NRRL 28638]|uniref:TM7S3/TM198-like domain-containing protein n=1 Tax=Conidiobolus coronatus (strain ATCC 28846 / CBS 209.66 / NRRL 28638) TaxID=796925 RepID=A0A137PDB0_CONC2|nr:hypothetical protein CONCODRAFT_4234 [Conidiobolus coronatus NRRL 28638]|eukprot:KXN72952.1 hypothetical protein CONCODRAFT_4234 [Conidiobolus coronatus NRRL 28638]